MSRFHPTAALVIAALATIGVGACKGSAPKDKPETLAKLKDCEDRSAGIALLRCAGGQRRESES